MSVGLMITLGATAFFMMAAFTGVLVYNDLKGTKSLDKRLDRLSGVGGSSIESGMSLLKDEDFLYGDAKKSFIEELLPSMTSMDTLFEQADFKMKTPQFMGLSGACAAGGLLLPVIMGYGWMVGVGCGAVLAFCPYGYLIYRRNARFKKFEGQLGEALELVARALRAGHSLASGMHVVAEEMPDPIAREFGRVYEEQNLGVSLEDAMRNLADRIPNVDLRFFVTAVIIQRQTGGDLAEILDKIGYLIRERFKLYGMIQALTGEGRISGVVLIALPFALLGIMMNIAPKYIDDLWTTEMGRQMSVFGIIMMIIGAYAIQKIIDIKV